MTPTERHARVKAILAPLGDTHLTAKVQALKAAGLTVVLTLDRYRLVYPQNQTPEAFDTLSEAKAYAANSHYRNRIEQP